MSNNTVSKCQYQNYNVNDNVDSSLTTHLSAQAIMQSTNQLKMSAIKMLHCTMMLATPSVDRTEEQRAASYRFLQLIIN